jgi:hypothetical protein
MPTLPIGQCPDGFAVLSLTLQDYLVERSEAVNSAAPLFSSEREMIVAGPVSPISRSCVTRSGRCGDKWHGDAYTSRVSYYTTDKEQ